MAQCAATKRDGSPCTLQALRSSDLCWAHDPKNAARRRRGQSRGGKSKPLQEIKDLKKQLEDLAQGVRDHEVGSGVATIVNQIINTRARLIELERKIREQDELLERIEALEGQTEEGPGGKRWGA